MAVFDGVMQLVDPRETEYEFDGGGLDKLHASNDDRYRMADISKRQDHYQQLARAFRRVMVYNRGALRPGSWGSRRWSLLVSAASGNLKPTDEARRLSARNRSERVRQRA